MQIKILVYYDIKPGSGETDQGAFLQKVVQHMMEFKKRGELLDFSSYRNVLGSPSYVSETVWRSMEDWAKYWQSSKEQRYLNMSEEFQTIVRVEMLSRLSV